MSNTLRNEQTFISVGTKYYKNEILKDKCKIKGTGLYVLVWKW